jgi:O-antigen ligase
LQWQGRGTQGGKTQALVLWLLVLGLIARVTVLIRQRAGSEFTSIDPLAAAEIALVFLTGIYVLASPRFQQATKLIKRTSVGMLLLFYVLGAVSAAWSPNPAFSLFRAVEVIVEILAVFVAMSYCRDFIAAERTMLWVSLIAILLTTSVTIRFNGLQFSMAAWHTNSYTASAAIVLCYCCGELFAFPGPRRRRFLIAMAIIGAAFVVLGTSSGSFIACICGIAVASLLARNRGLAIGLIFVAVVVGAVASGGDVSALLFPGKTENEISTMSNRLELWQVYMEQIKESPILGYGFAVIARLADTTYETNTHNFVLAVLGGTGAVGMFIILIWVGWLFKEIYRSVKFQQAGARGSAAAMTAALVNSMGCAYIGEIWAPPTLVFICLLSFYAIFVVNAGNGTPIPVGRTRRT